MLMRRSLAIAALGAALLVPPVWGQMRASRMVAPMGGRGFFPGNPVFFHGGFGFGGNHRFQVFFGRNPFFFHRRFFSPAPFYFPGSYGGGYPYPGVVQTAPPTSYYPPEYYERGDLARDIDVLTDKVDRLRQDLDTRLPAARTQSKAPDAAPEPTTVLVFKDKHIQEVRNYGVVGRILWVFDEQRAAKVPLDELDLDATVKLNDERGVEFQLPK